MKNTHLVTTLFVFLTVFNTASAQDSLVMQLARKHVKLFSFGEQTFKGEGWDYIQDKVSTSANVLIGEDHFSNEIPAFFKAVAKSTQFDNFYIELDPYSTEIIAKTFTDFTAPERKQFNDTYGHLYSFYSLKPEYELLEQVVNAGTHLLGSDQIVMYADRLIFQDILDETENPKAKEIYQYVMQQSQAHLEKFLKNPQDPMYFLTDDFMHQLDTLAQLGLSAKENQIIEDMKRSATIYKEQSHRKRIKLILHQLMQDYPRWNNAKNLFKYGANHLARGESFLTVFDVGNMVSNITASNYQESFHLMIVGESGSLGSPFEGFPDTPIDVEKGFYLSYLKPFFRVTEGNQWHFFDLLPLRRAIEKNELKVENLNLQRVIKGYDALVIIPEVTPARF